MKRKSGGKPAFPTRETLGVDAIFVIERLSTEI
jgi:hypothetical protein